MNTQEPTHWLVIDSDDSSIVAWWPILKGGAESAARRCAAETGHRAVPGVWDTAVKGGWVILSQEQTA